MKKDLIKDILTYLKDNEEARERFKKIYPNNNIFGKDYYIGRFDDYGQGVFENREQKTLFLIHALSSPNGKPICGFLEEEIVKKSIFVENGLKTIKTIKTIKTNHAKTLRTIYLDALDEGKSHDEAYKLINEKYNEIF